MEFKSLNNIETSFRQIRLFALVFICLCALVTGFAVWNSYSFAEKQRQKIYVLDNGKSLMLALSQDMAQNRPVEAKSHVRRFHELFFTLSPDKDAIESNVRRSLFLADKSAYNYYKLCPATDCPGKQPDGQKPCNHVQAPERHTQRQQPARLHHGSVHDYRKQGFADHQTISAWKENEITSKGRRIGRTNACAGCAGASRRANGWRSSS